jgi:hypothetical protein
MRTRSLADATKADGARLSRRADRRGGNAVAELQDRVGNRRALREVQIARRGEATTAADATRLAATAPRQALPHRREAERALGVDLSHIEAAVGPAASSACDALGAEAFAVGHLTVFGRAPDAATVIHEAAHTMQQQQRLPGAIPSRLPIVPRDAPEEREAAAGRPQPSRGGLAVALKPKKGDSARTPNGTDLLPREGSPTAVCHLTAGTLVVVDTVIEPNYRVTVTSGPCAGKSGIVPGFTIKELPPQPAATPSTTSSGRDPTSLSKEELQSELSSTASWLHEHPLDVKRDQMERYYAELRAEYDRRQQEARQRREDEQAALEAKADSSSIATLLLSGKPAFVSLAGRPQLLLPETATTAQVLGQPGSTLPLLKIPWDAGLTERGLVGEHEIIARRYPGYIELPAGFEGYDAVRVGSGTWTPFEIPGTSSRPPAAGFKISGGDWMSAKTLDLSWYPDNEPLRLKLEEYLGWTATDRVPNYSRGQLSGDTMFRIVLEEQPDRRILHIELAQPPNKAQSAILADAIESGTLFGPGENVDVVVVHPKPVSPLAKVINVAGSPAVGFGLGLVAGYSQQRAVESKVAETGYVGTGAGFLQDMAGDNILLGIGRFLVDPSLGGMTPIEQRMDFPVWRQNIKDKTAGKVAGDTLTFRFDIQTIAFSPGHSVVVTYELGADGKWFPHVPEDGKRVGNYVYFEEGAAVPDLNILINGSDSAVKQEIGLEPKEA